MADEIKPAAGAAVAEDPEVLKARQAAKAAVEELEKLAREARVTASAAKVRQACEGAKLPAKAAKIVSDFFVGHESVKDEDLAAKVNEVTDLAGLNAGIVTGVGGIQMGAEPRDKIEVGMEALFTRSNAPAHVLTDLPARMAKFGIERPRSIQKFFRDTTGLDVLDGFYGNRNFRRKVKQAIETTTWGDAWENVLNRVMVRWSEDPDLSAWRKIAVVSSVPNFVKQERIVKGGYANLPSVSEGADYVAATSPGDQGNGFTPAKYGYTESVTREAFLRDDVGALADIPQRMGLAAARTLYEFVFDLVKPSATTPTMDYDTYAVVSASHTINANRGTTALALAELAVVYKTMKKFYDQTNSKRLGIQPKYVLVPVDLAYTLYDILKPLATYAPGESTANSFARDFLGLEGIVVRHWSDATDWAVVADPNSFRGVEIGFVNGQEQPAMFTQNDESVGSLFDADKVVYKVRYEWGGTVVRHEAVYGEVVGG